MYECFVHMSMYALYVCLGLAGAGRGHCMPLIGVMDGCVLPRECWELHLDPL